MPNKGRAEDEKEHEIRCASGTRQGVPTPPRSINRERK